MAFLQDKDRVEIQKRFKELSGPVRLVHFTQEIECMYCRETRQLLEELSGLSDKISLEIYNLQIDKEIADTYKIDKIPATAVVGEKDYGIRLYGIPSGYEFSTLLEDILMVSKGDSGLSENTRQVLREIKEPVHLQVFVTPTCPYCPQAVVLAHQFAMENDLITADMVEATEFPHLSQKYLVRGVPKTIANDIGVADGAMPESHLLTSIVNLVTEDTVSE